MGYTPIAEHALIGDTRASALVTRDGTIDWLCIPRFDSPTVFGALLDAGRGGRWTLRPTGEFTVERQYVPETNVLETVFQTADGRVRMRDAMVLAPEQVRRSSPEHELLREVAGLDGTVQLETRYEPRPHYGRHPQLADRASLGIRLESDGQLVTLRSETDCRVSSDRASAESRFTVRAGTSRHLSLVSDRDAPAVLPPLGDDAGRRMEETARWWRSWSARCRYEGPRRDAVVRSALVLKLMVYAPSGAIVAAPTTSLPEVIGGDRNWDYRFCWLRDAAFTIRALYDLGYEQEADSFLAWLLHATRLTLPELNVMYDVYGETRLPERQLDWEGYAGSRPVRIGNAAAQQFQLDVYGELIDAAVSYSERGGSFDRDQASMLRQLGETVCRRWPEPDAGIWEYRTGYRHYTHSKAMAWISLDRLSQLHRSGKCEVDLERVERNRDQLGQELEERGYDESLGSHVSELDGRDVDASLLAMPLHGYGDWSDARIRGTIHRVAHVLADGPLVYRNLEGGQRTPEGAFGIASFWLVECLARIGELERARSMFSELLAYANDVGLLGEEIDGESGAALGNFPQALTHIGLINAACTLAECERQSRMEVTR